MKQLFKKMLNALGFKQKQSSEELKRIKAELERQRADYMKSIFEADAAKFQKELVEADARQERLREERRLTEERRK